MKPDAVKVAIDILRELGREEEARWIEHPGAVRELLKAPMCHCGVPFDALSDIHNRTCPVTAAWRAIGDPRWLADVERAHDEALGDDRSRSRRLEQEAAEERSRAETRSRFAALNAEEANQAFESMGEEIEGLLDFGVKERLITPETAAAVRHYRSSAT
jgi:hypothetical protein